MGSWNGTYKQDLLKIKVFLIKNYKYQTIR